MINYRVSTDMPENPLLIEKTETVMGLSSLDFSTGMKKYCKKIPPPEINKGRGVLSRIPVNGD